MVNEKVYEKNYEKIIQKKTIKLEKKLKEMNINIEKKIEPWSETYQIHLIVYDKNGEVIEEYVIYPSFDEYGNITGKSSEVIGIEYKYKDDNDWDSTYACLSKYEEKYGVRNFYDLFNLPAVFIYYLISGNFSSNLEG